MNRADGRAPTVLPDPIASPVMISNAPGKGMTGPALIPSNALQQYSHGEQYSGSP